jgi:DNA-directed RNA polymerase subunit F
VVLHELDKFVEDLIDKQNKAVDEAEPLANLQKKTAKNITDLRPRSPSTGRRSIA